VGLNVCLKNNTQCCVLAIHHWQPREIIITRNGPIGMKPDCLGTIHGITVHIAQLISYFHIHSCVFPFSVQVCYHDEMGDSTHYSFL